MDISKVNFDQKLSLFSEHWSPKIIAQMNDYVFKLAKIEGEFIWHSHPETDEVFIVLEGSMTIDFRDGLLHLQQGEMCVVPKTVEHKPRADRECHILLIEPSGTINTGDVESDKSVEDDWI
jgi:mannose-6-phosphate isomerase-like protein (cupin superfamily)